MFVPRFIIICLLVISVTCYKINLIRNKLSNCRVYSTVDDKVEVKQYFDNEGFSRWNKIYSDSDEVNKVQLDIRTGHQQTIDKVLNWISLEDNRKKTVCDAGCGVG